MAAGDVNATGCGASAIRQAPWPLVTFKRHPLRAVMNQIVILLWLIVVGYVGIKIIAGAYYLIFELYPPMTRAWHAAVPDSALRHDIRDVAEGYYATVLAHAFVFNPWKKSGLLSRITPFKQINRLSTRLERALHLPVADSNQDPSKSTAVLWLALTFVYAVPGFFVGRWVVQEVSNVLLHFQATASLVQPHAAGQGAPLWNRELSTLASGWPKKLIGVLSALFFGRRPAQGLYEALHKFAAGRRVASGDRFTAPVRVLLPPAYVSRCNDMAATTSPHTAHTVHRAVKGSLKATLTVLAIINIALFCVGEYVLLVVAQP